MKRAAVLSLAIAISLSSLSFAEEVYSPREKLVLMKERISRDLEKAKELRGRAMSQKGRLEEIIQKAEAGVRDPNMDPQVYEKVLAAAPAGIKNADEILAKTEAAIKQLELELGWTDRALKGLAVVTKNENYDPKHDLGFGMVSGAASGGVSLLRHGHDKTVPLGKDELFLPGDEIITNENGQTRLSSLGSTNYKIVAGSITRLKLEQDHKEKGTVWRLNGGKVHFAPSLGSASAPPRLVTSRGVVQGSEGSEFDVRVDDKGEVFIEAYQGRVEVKEPEKGTGYFIEAEPGAVKSPRWWEKEEI